MPEMVNVYANAKKNTLLDPKLSDCDVWISPIAFAKLETTGSVANAIESAFSSKGWIRLRIRGCLWTRERERDRKED